MILTITERPVSRLTTLAQEPSGNERCAAVGVTVSSGSPLEVPENLVRLSVGIEDVDDLLEDLEQALS